MSRAAVRAAILHMLPGYLASADIEAETIFRQAGMTAADAASPRIVSRAQVHNVLTRTASAVGAAEIGLMLGARAEPDKLGPTGAAMKAGATLASCLRAHFAFMPNMQSHVELGLRREGAAVMLTHRLVGDGESAWLLHEGAAAFYLRMLRHLLGEDWVPELVSFPHHCKGLPRIYQEFFGAPVVFGQHDETRIVFAHALLSKPLAGLPHQVEEDGVVFAPLDDFRPGARDIEIAVGRMVEATLPYRPIGLPEAAAVLGLSPRSLQRRLGEHGTVFEQIIDARRHAIATEQLAGTGAAVTTIAMLLGYSDAAHFNRAFRRWEGLSPTDYRRRQQGTA